MLLPLLVLLLVRSGAGAELLPIVSVNLTACETHVLEADCAPRQVIRVLRANYGRTSNEACNEDDHDWDTSCVSNSSAELMRERCAGHQSCHVEASNYVFHDPCPGVEKYLVMEFVCEPDPNPATVPPLTSSQQPPLSTTEAAAVSVVPEGEGVEGPFLLYCNTGDIRMLDLVSMEETVVVSGLNRSVVVDYDFARNVFVWTDSKEKAIFSGDLSSGDKRLLVANVTSYGVAVDWVHQLVYWTDSTIDVIDVMTLDGTKRRTLFSDLLDEPRGIVLDPGEAYLYWSDWGEVPKIEKSGMDGSGRRVIVSTGLKWPNGLAIDLEERRLFWIEAFHENLCSSDLEGEDVRRIISYSAFLKLPFSIDVFQEWVYWTEWTSNKENIFRADKRSGVNLTRVLDGDTTLMGIKIYHSSKQNQSVPNVCGDSNGGCSHLCLPSPTENNYTCACPNGMERTPDLLNCTTAPAVHATLLYCNRHDIRKYDLSTGRDALMVDGLKRATVIDFHYERQTVVWTDTDQKKIYRAALSSVGTRVTVAESVTSYGVAVDWLHDHIYWTDTFNNRLEVADMNATSWKKTLFNTDLDEPRAIVLNPHEGWMFWSDWGEVPKIERSGMDGTHRRVIVSRDIRWPNGLAIDLSLRQLFWVDGKLNTLCVVDFEGGHRRTLISSSSLMKHPFSLDLLGDWLYWVEWSSGKESVYRARKEDGSRAEKIFDGERTLMGLKVYVSEKQPPISGVFVCNVDNGPCSHLCLPAPKTDDDDVEVPTTNFTCACPNNLFLQPDGYNCSASQPPAPSSNKTTEFNFEGDSPLLLCANVDDIRVIDLRTHSDTRLIGDLTRAVAIDYLHANRTVVWTDIREDRICSAPLRPSGLVTELVDECSHADGLAADWIHGNLYWTDKGKDAVEVASLDGRWRRTLFSLDLDEPRAMALDPLVGWMFWTDWGRVPKIERAGMDGTSRTVIVSRNVQWPNGITVDLELSRVYWADAKTHEISSVNYDGVDRKVILMSWSYLKQPFSIDIVQDVMYWVEWRAGEECVYRADKLTGGNVTKIVDGRKWKNIMAIRVFHSSKQPPGEDRCDHGRCSHLCVPSPPTNTRANYTCLCPNNLQLSLDGRTCLAQAETTTSRDVPTEPPPTTGHGTGDDMGMLLYANRKDVRWLNLYTKEDHLLAEGFQRASAIDFHFDRKIAVWTDSEAKQIYSAPLWSGSPQTTLVEGNATANGVAVDWVHDLIFWTDDVRNSVSVMTLDGRTRRTLLRGGEVEQPRTIVVHPTDGWLFWTDWGRRPKIERAGMDGTHRKTIVATAVDWTHALTIDVYQRRLFWANGEAKKILCVEMDGSRPRTILHAPDLLHLPFSMDNLHEKLYWTEFLPLHESIFRTNKYTGEDTVKVLDKTWTNLMAIKIHHRWKQPPGVSRCGADNGRCSHLCLPTPRLQNVTNNFTCACPDHMLLDTDGATCISSQGSLTTDGPLLFSSTAPDVGNSSAISNEKAALQSADSSAPIIIGAVAALALIALVGVFVYHRQFLRRNLGNIIFNNPVYRRHTEDVSIEKSGRKSLVPLTSEFSELE